MVDTIDQVEIVAESEPQATIQEEASPSVEKSGSDQQSTGASNEMIGLEKIMSIKVDLKAVLGRVSLPVSRLSEIKKDDLIPLETKVGDEIELFANGVLLGQGEIVVIEDEPPAFGILLKRLVKPGNSVAEF